MFVPTTLNEELAKRCKSVFESQGLRVKVVERNTNIIKSKLVKSNPFKTKGCHSPSCNLCSTDNHFNCKAREVVYQISCAEDDEKDARKQLTSARLREA